jgi:hypothetical protein
MDARHVSDVVAGNRLLTQVQVHLNKSTSQEFTSPYAPFVFHGKHSHHFHPPLVMPDGVMYQSSHSHQGGAGITRAQVLGLHHGTSYVRLLGMDTASDEPQYISGGGSYIYRNLCCSRTGDLINTSVANGRRQIA